MKIASFTADGRTRLGLVTGGEIIDLAAVDPNLPTDLRTLLDLGEAGLAQLRRVPLDHPARLPLGAVRLEAPIRNPSKYLAIGMNYQDHAAEAVRKGIKIPDTQVWFNKQVSCITGPFDPVDMPRVSTQLDYEVELGVIIGRRCRHVTAGDAAAVIAGYFVANDVTVRDWQHRTMTWTLGKSFDSHGPIGPWMVTADEIADPHNLAMRMIVNGETVQSANTGLMIHNIFAQIALLTTVMTLEPGDLIATGTPAGVGAALDPPRFLKIGDVMRVEIDGIGHIENTVRAEPGGV